MSDFTPEQVERAAEVFVRFPAGLRMYWHSLSDLSIQERRKLAHAVLSAAGVPEELVHLRAGLKHVSGRMAEARAVLQSYADRIDGHVFGELASELDDQWCDFETGMPLGAPEKVAPVVEREKAARKEGFEEGRKFSSSAREDEIELAKLFDQHEKMLHQTAVYDGRCSCGHYEPRGDHSGHVAEALLAYLRGESK